MVDDMSKKPSEETINCAECGQLKNDKGILRCVMFDDAIIEDTAEKHCKDSMR